MQRESQRRRIRIGPPDVWASRRGPRLAELCPHRLARSAAGGSLAVHAALAGILLLLTGDRSAPPSEAFPEISVRLESPPEPLPLEPSVEPAEPDLFPKMASPIMPRSDPPDVGEGVRALAVPAAVPPVPDCDVEVTVFPETGAGAAVDDAGRAYWSAIRERIAAGLHYPPAALAAGVQGVVWVTIEVDDAGQPVAVEVAADAPAALSAAIRRAVRRAGRFHPPFAGVPRRARLPIRFDAGGAPTP